jgi:hypothetical protein
VQAETETTCVQAAAQQQFGFCVLAANAAHVEPALLWSPAAWRRDAVHAGAYTNGKTMIASFCALTLFTVGAWAYVNSVTYSGQGLNADGFGGYDLNQEICGVANGADADGPYLLWVLTATGSNNADITRPWGTVAMIKLGERDVQVRQRLVCPEHAPRQCQRHL